MLRFIAMALLALLSAVPAFAQEDSPGVSRTSGGIIGTGPVHMGSNLIDGSNINFTGGSFSGLSSLGAKGISYGAATTYVSGTAMSGAPGTNPAQLWSNVTLSGALTTGFGTPYFWQVADNLAWAASNGSMFYFSDNLGSGSDGNRIAMGLTFSKTSAAATAATPYGYVTLQPFMHADHGDGGTSTTPLGGFTNFNPDTRCNTSDWVSGCVDDEHDLRLYAGTHTPTKINMSLHYGILDAVHASGTVGAPNTWIDADLVLDASPSIGNGTGKGIVAMALGQPTQDIPWDTTASIGSALMAVLMNNSNNMSGVGQAYIDDGFRLPEVFARGKFVDNGAFYVSGNGDVTSGNATLAAVSTGKSLSVSGVVETSAVIVSGGTGAKVGAEIVDSIGGVWEVATITGSAAATVTLKRAGSAASCPASPTTTRMFNAVTPPTLTVTCSSRIGLTVQNSSGSLGFFGATPIVKATPSGACAGNTGCQALRDAMGNLGLINTGSISN